MYELDATPSQPATVEFDLDHGRTFAIARVSGDVDMASTDQLLPAFVEAMMTVQRLDVDLRSVTFMDSTGVSLLLELHRLAADRDVGIRFCNPTPMLNRLFSICGLASIVDVAQDPRSA